MSVWLECERVHFGGAMRYMDLLPVLVPKGNNLPLV